FIDPIGLVRVKCDCNENLDKAIANARLRMMLLETTGTATDPYGSNRIIAQTTCEKFTIIDPTTGKKVIIGSAATQRNDRLGDGPCTFLCTSVHEAYHRKQCQ